MQYAGVSKLVRVVMINNHPGNIDYIGCKVQTDVTIVQSIQVSAALVNSLYSYQLLEVSKLSVFYILHSFICNTTMQNRK